VKVKFYGRLAETIGAEVDFAAEPGCSVSELRDRIAAAHPESSEHLCSARARTCVAGVIVRDDYRLRAGETAEFLPPVSGG
jgi:molybdopterin converting factor small subunit